MLSMGRPMPTPWRLVLTWWLVGVPLGTATLMAMAFERSNHDGLWGQLRGLVGVALIVFVITAPLSMVLMRGYLRVVRMRPQLESSMLARLVSTLALALLQFVIVQLLMTAGAMLMDSERSVTQHARTLVHNRAVLYVWSCAFVMSVVGPRVVLRQLSGSLASL